MWTLYLQAMGGPRMAVAHPQQSGWSDISGSYCIYPLERNFHLRQLPTLGDMHEFGAFIFLLLQPLWTACT